MNVINLAKSLIIKHISIEKKKDTVFSCIMKHTGTVLRYKNDYNN